MNTSVQHNDLYRRPDCPWGKKAAALLRQQHVDYVDHPFDSREQENRFKADTGVETTPQVYLRGQRIGGYDELAEHFDVETDDDADTQSYTPVIALFATALLMAVATATGVRGFMGFALCLLATLKLMDIESFSEGFRQYDLLGARLRAYALAYPFAELGVGLAFLSGSLLTAAAWLAIVVGAIGGSSIVKAVYIDKQDLDCACVGGNYNVPLGLVSFLENALMAGMGAAIVLGLG
ncbi:MAG TPA: glutaredoxin [Spongiibacteraceae bacterium]|nr:glutaredoxin [Spongiibacteraceae bacterium]HCS29202.1 glutaredoxin [Spongiibacteraceae bacterium]